MGGDLFLTLRGVHPPPRPPPLAPVCGKAQSKSFPLDIRHTFAEKEGKGGWGRDARPSVGNRIETIFLFRVSSPSEYRRGGILGLKQAYI